MSQKPSIGRIVHFTFGKADIDAITNCEGDARQRLGQSPTVPATIVNVWGDDCVNLRVHPDGPGPDLWETSVVRKQGDDDIGPYWDWPTRVE